MKKALTVTFGAVLAAGLISTAQAHTDLFSGATVSIAGTYTKTSNNGLSVGDSITNTSVTNPFTAFNGQRPTFLEPDYNWDYALGVTFDIPSSPSYVFFHYDHYDVNEHRSDGPLFTNLTNNNPITNPLSATAGVDQRSDEFQMGITRELSFGRRFDVDLSAFFDYARIKREVTEATTQTAPVTLISRSTENKMRGYGVGIGALGRVYPFACQNWSLFAGIANSLLYAKEDYQQLWNINQAGALSSVSIDPEQSNAIVSKNDIKLGIEYDGFLNRQPGHDILFSLALGMRFVNYINAFKNGNLAFNFDDDDFLAVSGGSPEDWGRWGPYLQLTIGGPKT